MHFLFYGTLIAGSDNAVATAAHTLMRDLGPATTVGALVAIDDPDGWYPALLAGRGIVHGRLYEARAGFGEADLARLDAYEDFDPADPAGSLYVRETLRVTGPDGMAYDAQTYRFSQPLPAGAQPIADGDFRGWIARSGYPAYRTPS